MSNYSVVMTYSARNDLSNIIAYIAEELKEPIIAKKLVQKTKEVVMSLKAMPTRHSLVTDEGLAIKGIRKIMVEKYNIFYVVSEKDKTVTIVRILYDRRNWVNLL